jgi:hypothetical protein
VVGEWLDCVLDVKVHKGLHGGLAAFWVVEEEEEGGIAVVGGVMELLDPGEGVWVVDVLWGEEQEAEDVVTLCAWVGNAQSDVMGDQVGFWMNVSFGVCGLCHCQHLSIVSRHTAGAESRLKPILGAAAGWSRPSSLRALRLDNPSVNRLQLEAGIERG